MPYVGKSMDRRRNARRRQLCGAHTAISWNAAHPVGTRVRYWPIYPPIESVPHTDTVTRSEAWTIGDGTVVVCVDGRSGGVALSHIEVLAPDPLPQVHQPPHEVVLVGGHIWASQRWTVTAAAEKEHGG